MIWKSSIPQSANIVEKLKKPLKYLNALTKYQIESLYNRTIINKDYEQGKKSWGHWIQHES